MATLGHSRRVFHAVFPDDESPFLNRPRETECGFKVGEQGLWDTVTAILHPGDLLRDRREEVGNGTNLSVFKLTI
jgi:hypothetical protein